MSKSNVKKNIKIFVYIAGVYVICINIVVLVTFMYLFFSNDINVKEFLLSLIFVLLNSLVYFSIYIYYLMRKAYVVQVFEKKCIIHTYNKKYIFNKSDILSQKLSWQSFFRLRWKIKVKMNDKKKIFYVKEKLVI